MTSFLKAYHLVSNPLFFLSGVPIVYATSGDHQEMWKQQCCVFFLSGLIPWDMPTHPNHPNHKHLHFLCVLLQLHMGLYCHQSPGDAIPDQTEYHSFDKSPKKLVAVLAGFIHGQLASAQNSHITVKNTSHK